MFFYVVQHKNAITYCGNKKELLTLQSVIVHLDFRVRFEKHFFQLTLFINPSKF